MDDWIPKRKSTARTGLAALNKEGQKLLSYVDGQRSVKELASLAELPLEQAQQAIRFFREMGVLEEASPSAASRDSSSRPPVASPSRQQRSTNEQTPREGSGAWSPQSPSVSSGPLPPQPPQSSSAPSASSGPEGPRGRPVRGRPVPPGSRGLPPHQRQQPASPPAREEATSRTNLEPAREETASKTNLEPARKKDPPPGSAREEGTASAQKDFSASAVPTKDSLHSAEEEDSLDPARDSSGSMDDLFATSSSEEEEKQEAFSFDSTEEEELFAGALFVSDEEVDLLSEEEEKELAEGESKEESTTMPGGASSERTAAGAARGNYRQLFETELHKLPAEERGSLAQRVSGDWLSALCFDPDPAVIRALLENPHHGLEQARLIARHHQNATGLEYLAARAAFLRDAQVRRSLCRNPQTPQRILLRLLQLLPLPQLFQLNRSRENTERAKIVARQTLRRSFQNASGDEQAALVFNTDGRCLKLLVGLHFDPKATALLSRRTYTSTLLIQNLLRFPGTPPQIIKRLYSQQLVRRSPQLRRLILQHSNCPSEIKRDAGSRR